MNKKVFVDQPGWLGDIIFVMAIAQKYANEGYVVDYPVYDEYLEPASIQKNFPTINFIARSKFPNYSKYYGTNKSEDDEYIYLPFISNYHKHPSSNHMRYKYEMLKFSLDMWRNVEIVRDFNAEQKLIEKLNIMPDEKFNLINANYSTYHKRVGKMSLTINNNYRNIYMSIINEFNLFDWIGVIEKATTIHTIHTAVHYILDVLPNITNELHIYPRIEVNDSHDRIKFLFNKKYIYH